MLLTCVVFAFEVFAHRGIMGFEIEVSIEEEAELGVLRELDLVVI